METRSNWDCVDYLPSLQDMTVEQKVAFSDLMAAGPFNRIKIEVNDNGWYLLYIWTGDTVQFFVGPNLPLTLHLMATKLRERYGDEI